MADLGKLDRTDPTATTEGVWVPYKADIRFRIARLFNPRYTKRARELNQSVEMRARLRVGGETAAEAAEEILTQLAAETLLVGWENVELEGAVLPYSPANALRIVREFPDVRRFIVETAAEAEPYRLRTDQDAVGNSPAPSGGPSSGGRKSNG